WGEIRRTRLQLGESGWPRRFHGESRSPCRQCRRGWDHRRARGAGLSLRRRVQSPYASGGSGHFRAGRGPPGLPCRQPSIHSRGPPDKPRVAAGNEGAAENTTVLVVIQYKAKLPLAAIVGLGVLASGVPLTSPPGIG